MPELEMRALTQLSCRIDDVVRAARDTESLVIVRVDHLNFARKCFKIEPVPDFIKEGVLLR